jgi:hypothetical protein
MAGEGGGGGGDWEVSAGWWKGTFLFWIHHEFMNI